MASWALLTHVVNSSSRKLVLQCILPHCTRLSRQPWPCTGSAPLSAGASKPCLSAANGQCNHPSLSFFCKASANTLTPRAHDAFSEDLEDILGELVAASPWLKNVAERVNENVWRYFTDPQTWGHMPPAHLRVETAIRNQHRITSMLSLVCLEELDNDDTNPMS